MTEITEAGRQLAADLANAVCIERKECDAWRSRDFAEDAHHESRVALARLATQSIARDAELAEARADLREIDRLIGEDSMGWIPKAQNIAAKHREADPLDDLLWQTLVAWESGADPDYGKRLGTPEGLPAWDVAKATFRAELIKRGIELTTNPADRRMAWLTNTA